MEESKKSEVHIEGQIEQAHEAPELSTIEYDHTTKKLVASESVQTKKQKIRALEDRIEAIQLADAKVEDGRLRGIKKEAIADDVSAAGLSITEHKDKLQQLKAELKSSNKNWIQRAVVIGGVGLLSMFAPKEVKGQSSEMKAKADTEAIAKTTLESPKEDFLNYQESLKQKSDTSHISPEEMDKYMEKFVATNGGFSTTEEVHRREILASIYKDHSPYVLNGKKIALEGLIPGYDLAFGHDKDERILLNEILTNVDFDTKEGLISYDTLEGYGNVLQTFDVPFKKEVGEKIIQGGVTLNGEFILLNVQIKNKHTNKLIAETFISTNKFKKVDHRKFTDEFNAALLGK